MKKEPFPLLAAPVFLLSFFSTGVFGTAWSVDAEWVFEMALHWHDDESHSPEALLEELERGFTPTPAPTLPPEVTEKGGAGIARDVDGTLYLVDFIQVYTLNPDGSTTLFSDLSGILTSQSANPHLTYDPVHDRLYVSSPSRIAKIELRGGEAGVFAESLSDPSVPRDFGGMCVDATGNLYVARMDGVFRYDADGEETDLGYPMNWSMRPVDIARGSDGTLFVTAVRWPRDLRDSGVLYVRRPGSGWYQANRYFSGPYYLCYHPAADRVYISNLRADKVSVLHPQTLEVERFFSLSRWPRGILPLQNGDLMISHRVGGLDDDRPAVTVVPGDLAEDVPIPQITLSNDSLAGHTNRLGIRGVGIQTDVTAHNSFFLGETRLLAAGFDETSVTVTLPLVPFSGNADHGPPAAWVLPGDTIWMRCAGRESNRVPFKGPAPGELVEEWAVENAGTAVPPEKMPRGSWLRIFALGNFFLSFPDDRYAETIVWYGDSFFMKFDDYETVTFEMAFQSKQIRVVSAVQNAEAVLEVDPERDFTYYLDGSTLEIPAGTLPPGGPYEISLASHEPDLTFPGVRAGARYSIRMIPEPERLSRPIVITTQYDPSELGLSESEISLGVVEGGAYYAVPGVQRDTMDQRFVWMLPSGTYSDSENTVAGTKRLDPRSYTVNTVLSFWSTWGFPQTEYRLVGSDFIVQAGPDVSTGYAEACLAALRRASGTFVGMGYEMPPGPVRVWVEKLGEPSLVGGFTTRGIFGTPWIKMNANLPLDSGGGLDWNTAHELFHVAQRQITTNLTTHWFDEATAQWAASVVYPNSTYYIDGISGLNYGGADFPTRSIPETYTYFGSDYSAQQGYSAVALVKYIAEKNGDTAVAALLAYDQLFMGRNFRGALEAVTGQSIADFCEDFGKAYWTQDYDKARDHAWPLEAVSSFLGEHGAGSSVSWDRLRPALSSDRATLTLGEDVAAVEISAVLGSSQHKVYVYGDPNASRFQVRLRWTNLGTLDQLHTRLTASVSSFKHLRLVSINSDPNEASPVQVRIRLRG